ncbi:MAG: sulfatase-like hydrolase/transferase [Pirellulales bacterium]|nr:sulfatase-like hydrolase/transferase [Pirellulales bacterium]
MQQLCVKMRCSQYTACIVLLLVGMAVSMPVVCVRAAEKDRRPNILFMFTDDQSHRSVSCYDESHPWVETPNIDHLAAEGMRFTDAYNGTWCLPVRAMMLTGRQPHGIEGLKIKKNPEGKYDPAVCRFWPAELRKAGYHTAFIGKWHLSPDAGHGRDWDHSIVWNHAELRKAGGYYVDQKLNFDGGPHKAAGGYSTDNYTHYAEEYIKRDHKKPWFLWLCYDGVHQPFTPAERHDDRYRNNEPVPIPKDIYPPRPDKPRYMKNYCQWKRGKGGLPERRGKTLPGAVRQYNRAVLAIDEGVGRIVQALKETGQLDKTFIVFTSDQGYAWGQHGFQWKVAPYDDNLRVPMIVRMPQRVACGTVCRQPIGGLDLIPTFFRLAETPLPWKMHGHDLSPLLKNPQARWSHPVVLEELGWAFGSETDGGMTNKKAFPSVPWWLSIRNGRYKYICTLVKDEIEELYDLKSDPEELHNLALQPKHRRRLTAMRRQLIEELRRTDAGLAENLPAPKRLD